MINQGVFMSEKFKWSAENSICVMICSILKNDAFDDPIIPTNINYAGSIKMNQLKYWPTLAHDDEVRYNQTRKACLIMLESMLNSGILVDFENKFKQEPPSWYEVYESLFSIMNNGESTIANIAEFFDEIYLSYSEVKTQEE
ncbi:hypothetical protein ACQZVH_004532 [Vibrio parahaemolyticus]